MVNAIHMVFNAGCLIATLNSCVQRCIQLPLIELLGTYRKAI